MYMVHRNIFTYACVHTSVRVLLLMHYMWTCIMVKGRLIRFDVFHKPMKHEITPLN